jgi:hypothetical protein
LAYELNSTVRKEAGVPSRPKAKKNARKRMKGGKKGEENGKRIRDEGYYRACPIPIFSGGVPLHLEICPQFNAGAKFGT